MADEADVGKVRRGYRLPRVPVAGRDELEALFARWDRRLRARARRRFAGRDRRGVDAAVRAAMARMLQADTVSFDHPLQYVLDLAANELRRRDQEQRRLAKFAGVPIDAVMRLPDGLRDTFLRAASGERYADIALSEGLTESAIKHRVHRARALLSKATGNGSDHPLPAFFAGLLPLMPRRLRGWLSSAPDAAAVPSTAGLVPIVVCSLFSSGALSAPARQPPAVVLPVAAAAAGYGAAHDVGSQANASARPAASATGGTAAPAFAAAVRPASHRAADETPEDVTLTSAATPSAGHGAVVAIGMGHTCACPVLMRSLDGGGTWTATDGPPQDATQLVVPPDYPRDPRIFAGVDAFDATGAPYMSVGFGAPFVQLTGLPPGHVAVSSAFDSSDPRVFSASLAGVWSLRLGAVVPHLEVGYPSALSIAVATLATPPPGGPAVLVWAPVGSVSGTSLPSLGSPVFRCPVIGACVQTATLPVTPGTIIAGTDGVVVAYQYNLVFLSSDRGSTFAQLPTPRDGASVWSVTSVAPSSLWASVTLVGGAVEVVQFSMAGGGWTEVAGASFQSHVAADLIIVDARRVIAVLQGAGYRCTAVGTGIWLPRCPTAKE